MADSSEPAFLFLYRKEAVAPVDYLSTFATAPFNSCFNFLTSLPGKRGAASGLFPLAEYYEKKLLALTIYSD